MRHRCSLRLFLAVALVAAALLPAAAPARAGDLWARSPAGHLSGRPAAERLGVGVLLVARENLPDPNFFETVVLLLSYDAQEGAAGLVVNRRTQVTIDEAVDGRGPFAGRDDTLYLGGPVAVETIIALQRAAEPPEGSTRILDDIYLIGDRRGIRGLVESHPPAAAVRFYAGYAGWNPGQLEDEISRGVWHVVAGDAARVFSDDPGEDWADLIRIVFGPRA